MHRGRGEAWEATRNCSWHARESDSGNTTNLVAVTFSLILGQTIRFAFDLPWTSATPPAGRTVRTVASLSRGVAIVIDGCCTCPPPEWSLIRKRSTRHMPNHLGERRAGWGPTATRRRERASTGPRANSQTFQLSRYMLTLLT
jgi:hypothetical protein